MPRPRARRPARLYALVQHPTEKRIAQALLAILPEVAHLDREVSPVDQLLPLVQQRVQCTPGEFAASLYAFRGYVEQPKLFARTRRLRDAKAIVQQLQRLKTKIDA